MAAEAHHYSFKPESGSQPGEHHTQSRGLNLIFVTCPRLRVTHFRYSTTGPEQGFTFPIQHPLLPNTPSAIHKPQNAREGNRVSKECGKLQGLSGQRSHPHGLTCCSSLERTQTQKGAAQRGVGAGPIGSANSAHSWSRPPTQQLEKPLLTKEQRPL